MKNFVTKIICAACILLIFAGHNTVVAMRDRDEQIAKLQADVAIAEMNSSGGGEEAGGYKDGTYTGSAQGYGGTVTMEVVIKDGKIAEINPKSYAGEDAVYWQMAIATIPQLVESQGAKADTVSGATFSSAGIINGTIDALSQAM